MAAHALQVCACRDAAEACDGTGERCVALRDEHGGAGGAATGIGVFTSSAYGSKSKRTKHSSRPYSSMSSPKSASRATRSGDSGDSGSRASLASLVGIGIVSAGGGAAMGTSVPRSTAQSRRPMSTLERWCVMAKSSVVTNACRTALERTPCIDAGTPDEKHSETSVNLPPVSAVQTSLLAARAAAAMSFTGASERTLRWVADSIQPRGCGAKPCGSALPGVPLGAGEAAKEKELLPLALASLGLRLCRRGTMSRIRASSELPRDRAAPPFPASPEPPDGDPDASLVGGCVSSSAARGTAGDRGNVSQFPGVAGVAVGVGVGVVP